MVSSINVFALPYHHATEGIEFQFSKRAESSIVFVRSSIPPAEHCVGAALGCDCLRVYYPCNQSGVLECSCQRSKSL